MRMRVCLAGALLALGGCNSSSGPDLNLTGNWSGNWYTTAPAGPLEIWSGALTQSGTSVTGSIGCEGLETYTVSGSNLHNAVALTLLGTLEDTAHFNGTLADNSGTVIGGTFSDNDGAGCFSGFGNFSGRIQ